MDKKPLMMSLEMKAVVDKHRKQVMESIRSLPSDEVLDLVAAGLDARGDLDILDVRKFMTEMQNWAWKYE